MKLFEKPTNNIQCEGDTIVNEANPLSIETSPLKASTLLKLASTK